MFRLLRFLAGGGGLFRPFRSLRKIAMLAVTGYVAVLFGTVWYHSQPREPSAPAQAIVVLGAAQYNGRPSPVLQSRLDHALDLYNERYAPLIVVTGGRQDGDRMTEAQASANYLLKRGVRDAAIAREVQGRDTYQSLAAVRRFLVKRDVRTVILVTDGYHSARVAAVADEVGLAAVTSPSSSAGSTERMLRETAALFLGRVFGFRRISAWTSE